jgi:hypothetical protein
MNQLAAAERYAQELSIRYVSGLRNRKLFDFKCFDGARNHPIDNDRAL